MLLLAFQMGMNEKEFWNSSPKVFSIRLQAYQQERAQQDQQAWELTRWQTALLLSPHSKKPIKPRDLCVFPWEEENEPIEFILPPNFKKLSAAMDTAAKKERDNSIIIPVPQLRKKM